MTLRSRPPDPDRDLPDPGHENTLCHDCGQREIEDPADLDCTECEGCRDKREAREARNAPEPDPGISAAVLALDGYSVEGLLGAYPELVDVLRDADVVPGLKAAVDAARDNAQ